jgi:hypothetical protein
MCHPVLQDASFWRFLRCIDEEVAAQASTAGCPACGGALHRADYPRKPRGVTRSLLDEESARRLSFCCDRDTCRRRLTPASGRFLGRRVFLGAVVVLATALTQGLSGRRASALCEQIPVSIRTLRRWRQWWQRDFVASSTWASIRARLATPVASAELPRALLVRCAGENAFDPLIPVLRLIAPLSAGGR